MDHQRSPSQQIRRIDLRIHGSASWNHRDDGSRSRHRSGGVLSGSDELDGSIEMPEIHRLGASAPDSETNLRAGATSDFTISVTKEGNAADSIREVRVTLAGCEETTVSGQERHVGRNIAPTSEGESVELEFTVESSPDHETARARSGWCLSEDSGDTRSITGFEWKVS